MLRVRKHWEFYFWLPLVFLISFAMFVVSCGKEDEPTEPLKIITVQTPKPTKPDNIIKPDKPIDKPDNNEDEVVNPDNTVNPDEVIFDEKVSDYTGNVHISFTNNTLGSLTPCG